MDIKNDEESAQFVSDFVKAFYLEDEVRDDLMAESYDEVLENVAGNGMPIPIGDTEYYVDVVPELGEDADGSYVSAPQSLSTAMVLRGWLQSTILVERTQTGLQGETSILLKSWCLSLTEEKS